MSSLFWIFILSVSTSYAREKSDKEILDLFKPTPVCTDYGAQYGFSFSNLDGYVGVNGNLVKLVRNPKTKQMPHPQNECVQLPKGHVASLVEKDECDATIAIHPQSISAEQATYLSSSLHTPPFRLGPLTKPNFNPEVNPFNKFKVEWDELARMRASAANQKLFEADWESPSAKAFAEKYKKAYKSLVAKTLTGLQLKKSDFEVISYGYMGCH